MIKPLHTFCLFAVCWLLTWNATGCAKAAETTKCEIVYQQAASSSPWSPRHGHTTLVFKDRMWILGGTTSDPAVSGVLFDLKSDVWSSADGVNWKLETPAAAWPGRYLHENLVFRNKMWILGGLIRYAPMPRDHIKNPKVNANDVWCSMDGIHWVEVTPAAPWVARHVFTSVVHNDRMWVIAGAGKDYYNDVWSSSDGRNWAKMEGSGPRFLPRKNVACASFHGKIWVLSGVVKDPSNTGKKKHYQVADVWNSVDGTDWTQVTASAPWQARDYPGVVVHHDKIWLTGGTIGKQREENIANDLWHSPDGITWTEQETIPPWPPRYCKPVVFNDRVWILGGITKDGTRLHDGWWFRVSD